MARFNYTPLAATALKLITEFGLQATLRRPSASTAAWEPGAGAATDYPIQSVLQNYTVAERRNTMIQQGDRRVIFAAKGLAIAPAIGDQIVIPDDGVYQIMDVIKAAPAGFPIVYTAQCRR